jgi:hypothetical protein
MKFFIVVLAILGACYALPVTNEINEAIPINSSFQPTEKDVEGAVAALRTFLPYELVAMILEEAEYWPSLLFKSNKGEERHIRNDKFKSLSTGPLPIPGRRIRRIHAIVISHDQGWATFEGNDSWTWGELHFENADGGDVKTMETYRNARACYQPQLHHTILTRKNESLLAPLHTGSVISIVNGAIYPGWCNSVLFNAIKIEYSIV